ncbi:MAG: DUF4153 domain-containing protein [Alkaliphilus sp.]
MKKIDLVLLMKQGLEEVYKTFKRFSLAIILCLIFAIMTICRIEIPYEKLKDIDEILDRVMAVVALGIPFSLSVNLLVERFWEKNCSHVKIVINFLKVSLLVLYYYFALPNTDMVPMLRLAMLALAMTLVFLSALYLFKKENFEVFITKIMTKVAMTVFFSAMLGLGITFTLFAVQSLLYENMSRDLYAYTWIIINFVFAPTQFLSGFPNIDEKYTVKDYSKVIKLLLIYIAMPIIAMFTLVLYTYFAKIIVTQIWPEGIVSYLVLSYAGAGIATLFLVKPFLEENKWVSIFTKVLTKTVIPLLGMMFIAIGIRIGEFGFTESRYYILIIGIWATFAMIFLNFDKGKRNVVLPISLALVLLISVVGPLSAFNISIASQNQRLQSILQKNQMIYDGQIIKSDVEIDNYDKREISGIIRYFDKTHGLDRLQYLPSNFAMKDMEKTFGFEGKLNENQFSSTYFHFAINYEAQVVDISSYDVMISGLRDGLHKIESRNDQIVETQDVFVVKREKNNLVVIKEGEEILKYDLTKISETLIKEYGLNFRDRDIDSDDLIVIEENNYARVKLVFNSIFGSYDEDSDAIEVDGVEALILIDIK